MDAVFLRVLNMSLTAGWLILAVVIVRLVFRKAPKSFRCLLWILVAFRLLCPISIESAISMIPATEGPSECDIPVMIKDSEPIMQYVDNDGIEIVIDSDERKEIMELSAHSPIDEQVVSDNSRNIDIVNVISVIWFIGILGILTYSIISYVRLRKRVKTSAYIWDRIWISDEVETPFIFGIRNPRIYLPSAMDEETGNQVIAHEQAHLRRKDHIWKPLGFVIVSVYWFNPLVWMAYILFCRDIELACDEKVVKRLNGDEKKLYSKALVSCSVPHRIISACPVAFGELRVKERVKEILAYKKPAVWLMVLAVLSVAITGACFMTDPKEILEYDENTYAVGVNGTVTIDEFDIAYNSYLEEGYTENAAERRANEYCFGQEALYQQALKQGYSADKKEVTDYVNGVKESFLVDENGKTKFEEYVKKYGSEEAYFEVVNIYAEKEIIKSKYIDELQKESGSSDERNLNRIISVFSEEENFEVIEENLKKYKENNIPATYKEERTEINFTNNSFRVNNSMPEYVAYVYYDEENPNVSKQVSIKDKETQELIQRLDLVENERFGDELIYFADVNFDGNTDLLIPRIRNVSSVFFAAYLYIPERNQFIYEESFDDIRNFVLDVENERILSRNAGNDVMTHYVYKFNDVRNKFVLSDFLYIGRDFGNNEHVSKMRIIEKRYDDNNMEEVVNDVMLESDKFIDALDGDFEESALLKYYEEGSYWDLNGDIWREEYYN